MSITEKIARERSWRNRHSASHQGFLGDPDRIDADGVVGELAFAQEFQIPVDQIKRLSPTQVGNFVLLDGTRVDVRSSRAQQASLIVPPKVVNRGGVDVFVLAQVTQTGKSAKLIGWATRAEVKEAPVRSISTIPGAHDVHVIMPFQLRDIDTLKMRHLPYTKGLFDE